MLLTGLYTSGKIRLHPSPEPPGIPGFELGRGPRARTHEHPEGRWVRVTARTVQSWYYDYLRGGFAALHPKTRSDQGTSKAIEPPVADLILRAKKEKLGHLLDH